MSVIIKGDSPFDAFIVSGIKGCHTEHIKFYNISFNCKTIEDADGRVFTRREERKNGKWLFKERREPVYDISGVKTWGTAYMCPECGFIHTVIEDFGQYVYCPNCGADMRGEEHDR